MLAGAGSLCTPPNLFLNRQAYLTLVSYDYYYPSKGTGSGSHPLFSNFKGSMTALAGRVTMRMEKNSDTYVSDFKFRLSKLKLI
jgi:hypothetical protein